MVYEGHCSSAFVLRIDHVPVLLIDVGFGVVRQCRAFVQSIPKYIYVTHNHGDHAAELPICVAIEKHVTVVAQEDVAELLQTHRMSEMVGAPLDVTWLKCQTEVRTAVTGDLSISVHRARHSQLCYGCVVYYRGQAVLAVSGDSGYHPALYHAIGQARTVFIDAREKSSDDHASYDEIRQFIAEHWSTRQDSVWIYHHDEHETTHVTGLQLALPDIGKLKRLNWKFETPAQHRPLIWKLMLGTLPQHRETWEFVQQQLNEQYKDLKRTSSLINAGVVDESIRISRDPQHIERTSQLMCAIYAMRQEFLMRERDSDDNTELKRIATVFATMFDNECEAYWCFHKFMSNSLHRRGNKGATIMHHVNNLAQLLKIHDPVLYQHLLEINTKIESLSYAWFRSVFGVCFVEPRVLESLWDRIIRVSYNLMPCIALAILHQFREHIMNFNDSKSIYHILKNITGSQFLNAELVLTRAVDIYTQWKNDSSSAHDSMK